VPPKFDKIFSVPREPETALTPGQYFELKVPEGHRVLITDVYIENMGIGTSVLRILEQTGPETFAVRYAFRGTAGQVTALNFTVGLKLGDETPIAGSIRIENAPQSGALILPRVNGVLVP